MATDVFLQTKMLWVTMGKKCGNEDRIEAQLSEDLLVKIKCKKKMHRQWVQVHVY